MVPNVTSLLAPLGEEAQAVLATLAAAGPDHGMRLNELAAATSLPTGHVGRHLRTLERERLARYGAGAWRASSRGMRRAADAAAQPVGG